MSYLKTLNTNDVTVVPFTVNKSFTFEGATDFTSSQVGIDILLGDLNSTSPTGILPTSSYYNNTPPQSNLVYSNIKHLYYSNYISGSNGIVSPLATASFNSDGTISGAPYTSNYINSLQSPSKDIRNSPTGNFNVFSIPSKLYGEYIKPNSLYISNSISTITDDGDGNLIFSDFTSSLYGNIIYPDGIIITNDSFAFPSISKTAAPHFSLISFFNQNSEGVVHDLFANYVFSPPSEFLAQDGLFIENISSYDLDITSNFIINRSGGANAEVTIGFLTEGGELIVSSSQYITGSSQPISITNNFTLSPQEKAKPYIELLTPFSTPTSIASFTTQFSGNVLYTSTQLSSSLLEYSSSLTLYETQYKCTIRANEFNYSLNPSLKQSGSFDQYQDFTTGSDFSPYVTTVGLYNENQELLAVAKLAQPLPTSQTTDTTILINLDR